MTIFFGGGGVNKDIRGTEMLQAKRSDQTRGVWGHANFVFLEAKWCILVHF